ncbi:uncharacterized protein LOC126077516 [Elephas maximus indicus]|uniref:uncharacterized protein LOC126077516 n=1 Tax=Elephas maximus indicus TaxID=99487 RepID=UPI0021166D05|nr:uncharacterized protein LOC126077516 [Elephas maximus indicus]
MHPGSLEHVAIRKVKDRGKLLIYYLATVHSFFHSTDGSAVAYSVQNHCAEFADLQSLSLISCGPPALSNRCAHGKYMKLQEDSEAPAPGPRSDVRARPEAGRRRESGGAAARRVRGPRFASERALESPARPARLPGSRALPAAPPLPADPDSPTAAVCRGAGPGDGGYLRTAQLEPFQMTKYFQIKKWLQNKDQSAGCLSLVGNPVWPPHTAADALFA